jgi:hypothetical protein
MQKLFSFDRTHFSQGLSVSKSYPTGFFKTAIGIDMFRTPDTYGLPCVGFANSQRNGYNDEIRAFVKRGVYIYAYGANGYLYRIDSTSISGTGYTPTILDSGHESGRTQARALAVYNDDGSDKLFYFFQDKIGMYDIGGGTFNNSYKTGLDDSYHDALEFKGILYFCNGDSVGSLNGTTLNLAALQLPLGYVTRDIKPYKTYIAILAQSYNSGVSKLFLWDTYTTGGYNYEYTINESCTALEIFNDDLAVFGNNVRLFNFGAFNVIWELNPSMEMRYCKTAFFNNTLYWKDYNKIMAYGSPVSKLPPCLYSPLAVDDGGAGSNTGAIFPLDTESSKFLVNTNASGSKVWYCGAGNALGVFETVDIAAGHNRLKKFVFTIESPYTTGNVSFRLKINNNGLEIANIVKSYTYSSTDRVTRVIFDTNTLPLDNFSFSLDVGYSDLLIKNCEIYGEPSEQPTK